MGDYRILQRLQEIEREFELLIKNDRKNWVRVAKLLRMVEEEGLYAIRAASFTQYVLDLARKNQINPSTLWRARASANIYLELAGLADVEQLDEGAIRTTPEQLELYGKVRTIAPERIVSDLRRRMLRGEGVRHELQALWKTYRPLKQGKTERGRRTQTRVQEYSIGPAEASQFLMPYNTQEQLANLLIAKSEYVEFKLDRQKRDKYSVSEELVWRANIANALRAPDWLEYTLRQDHLVRLAYFAQVQPGRFLGHPGHELAPRLDVVALCGPQTGQDGLLTFGASIRVNMATLKNSAFLEEARRYCHYYYVAVPLEEAFADAALLSLPRSIGVIGVEQGVDRTRHTLKVLRRAQRTEPDCAERLALLSELLGQQLEWQ